MNSLNLHPIRNLLFDLGGVVINLDPQQTTEAFARLAGIDPSKTARYLKEIDLFGHYETGAWTDDQFRQGIRELLRADLSDAQIDAAWNAMLLDIPAARVALIQRLRNRFRTLVLSNTNDIHLRAFNQILYQSSGVPSLEDLFDETYYSHRVGLSKPAPEIFKYVLEKANLKAGETLFLDDNAENVRAAQQLGIQTVHIQPPLTILALFGHV